MSDPDFYTALSEVNNNEPNIAILDDSDTPASTSTFQPNVVILKEDFSAIFNADSGIYTADASKIYAAKAVVVPETAAVMEVIMHWLYEDSMPEILDEIADIYNAAKKYQLKTLQNILVKRLDRFNSGAKSIVKMMESALEQQNEEVLKKLVSIFKEDKALRRAPEFTALLNQYGVRLMEYFIG